MEENWSGKQVLVLGAGISGIGALKLLLKAGASPSLYDGNDKLIKEDILKKCGLPADTNFPCYFGELPKEAMDAAELAVISPGFPLDKEPVLSLKQAGIPVWGELELAWHFEKGRIVAITGTNGKTTTTSLTGEILAAYFADSAVAGNIGASYAEQVLSSTPDKVTAVEVSSFQLESVDTFHPVVSAILNITPDHLNRHHTMENYAAAKENITKNQTADDVCVLNYDNEYTRAFGDRCPARVVYFSSEKKLDDGYFAENEILYAATKGEVKKLLSMDELHLVGKSNAENVMAAIAVTEALGVPEDVILNAVRAFRPVEHRIEFVAEKKGVVYYNDSKGTNPDAAIQGILAMSKPTLLIGGGFDKESEYDEWIESFGGKVRWLVLIGQTKEKIAACARAHGFTHIVLADTLEEAFAVCADRAQPGEAVLLSPACASWDMFPNYEVRGRRFKELVQALED